MVLSFEIWRKYGQAEIRPGLLLSAGTDRRSTGRQNACCATIESAADASCLLFVLGTGLKACRTANCEDETRSIRGYGNGLSPVARVWKADGLGLGRAQLNSYKHAGDLSLRAFRRGFLRSIVLGSVA